MQKKKRGWAVLEDRRHGLEIRGKYFNFSDLQYL